MSLRPLRAVGEDLTRWATSDVPRIPTGYQVFDAPTNGGIATGELAMMIARTGVGKTWFLINLIRNNPTVPALFFSLEMHGRYILSRLAATSQGVTTDQIEAELATRGRSEAVEATIEQYPLLMIDDRPNLTGGDMVEACDEYEQLYGLRPALALVDYLELVRSFGMTQQESVDRLAWGMKEFCREADVACVTLHQVKRGEYQKRSKHDLGHANEGHRPLTKGDMRFGGEMAADYIFGMYRPSLDPSLPSFEREYLGTSLNFQFLKTRAGKQPDPRGVQHFYDEYTGLIAEIGASH